MRRSTYITMPDGVRLAIDVYCPPSTASGTRVPTILRATPYGRRPLRAQDPGDGKYFLAEFLRAGYAVAMLDIRGTGASFGTWTSAWSPDEVDDLGHVIDWIAEQPWSNARVAGIGGSYEANLAWLMASLGRPALAASVLRFPDFDPYSEVLWPGGIFNESFICSWSDATGALNGRRRTDEVVSRLRAAGQEDLAEQVRQGPQPVDDDHDQSLLALAIRDHAGNFDVAADERARGHRDDPVGVASRCLDPTTPRGRADAISASGTPLLVFASWLDASTAAGALRAFLTLHNPQSLLIGPWGHGAEASANPLQPQGDLVLSPAEQFSTIRSFLDPHLLDSSDAAATPPSTIRYYVYGEDRWRETTTWPPGPEARHLEMFLGPDGSLTGRAPTQSGTDTYTVDFGSDPGAMTRWHTQLTSGPVDYPHRNAEATRLLTYTSAPLTSEVTIVGAPTLDLFVASTATDGAFVAYLEQIDLNDHVTYLTDGQLRAQHRALSHDEHAEVLGAAHSYLRADAKELQPGEVEHIAIALQPTAVTVPKGFRLRLGLSGHPGPAFPRIPSHGSPTWTVQREPGNPSRLRIPVQC